MAHFDWFRFVQLAVDWFYLFWDPPRRRLCKTPSSCFPGKLPTHVVRLFTWSIKNTRPVSVFDICQPDGKAPSPSDTLVVELVPLLVEVCAASGLWDECVWLLSPSSIWRRPPLASDCDRWELALDQRKITLEESKVGFTFENWDDSMSFDDCYGQRNKFVPDYLCVLFQGEIFSKMHEGVGFLHLPSREVMEIRMEFEVDHDDESFRIPAKEWHASRTLREELLSYIARLTGFRFHRSGSIRAVWGMDIS